MNGCANSEKVNINVKVKIKMATKETFRFYSDANMLISDRKTPKLMRIFSWSVYLVILLTFYPKLCDAQYPGGNPLLGDRDPRFYSRPGVDYAPQNPGDKDYR